MVAVPSLSCYPDLAGQQAIVTGAGRGIGAAIARALARAGAAVAVVARTSAEVEAVAASISEANGKATPFVADVCDLDAVNHVVNTVVASSSRLDILVNNAGTWSAIGPSWKCEPSAWWSDFSTSVLGTYLFTRAALNHMVPAKHGRVVNVASTTGTRAFPHGSSYGTAKAAVLRLTQTVAAEVAEHGVQVFAITPGVVPTRLFEEARDSEAGQLWLPELQRWRLESPDAGAELVLKLASGIADKLTGRFITVWDPIDELVARADEICAKGLYVLALREREMMP